MAQLQIWTVYDTSSGFVYITRGKKTASCLALHMNKAFKLQNNKTRVTCDDAKEFFTKHQFDRNRITFCWSTSIMEKTHLYASFLSYQKHD